MKYLIFIMIALSITGCKSLQAQDTIKKKPVKPVYRGENIDIAPGQFKFQAIIKAVKDTPVEICALSFSNTVELEIVKIYVSGFSTRNLPSVKNTYSFILKTSLPELKAGMRIDVLATEMICKDMTQSYFQLEEYSVIEP